MVTDYAGTAAEADTLVFSQAQSGQATFEHTGDDLVIHAYGDDNSVTLKDYFRDYGYPRWRYRTNKRGKLMWGNPCVFR
ncbi:hypothetical protein DSA95_25835 [Salmonella enterica subsp. enterica serovar Plymouth]|nr:hypothetical protein [Salmonella enterica subsp. enterica serovar Plymouth]EBY2850842.1 hypothetical protein [Salmonella enterica subsp. enterica serovar Plymouth]